MTDLPLSTRRWAARLRYFTFAIMAGLGVLALYAILRPDMILDPAIAAHQTGGVSMWPVGGMARALLLALAAVYLVAVMVTLYHLAALFGLYALGAALTPEAALQIRRIGLSLAALAGLNLVGDTLRGLILSIDAPVGHRVLAISIDGPDLGFALAAGLMLLIGAVMRQATAAAEENRGFI